MARWMKVLAVVLAAVVGLVPVINQIGYASYLESPVLPTGREATDEDLEDIIGEVSWLLIAAIIVAISIPASYCIVEAMEGRTPRWDIALALLGLGTVVAVAGYYAAKTSTPPSDSQSLLMDLVGPYRSLPPENAARWRF